MVAKKRRKLRHVDKKALLEQEIALLQSGVTTLQNRDLPPGLHLQHDPVLLPLVKERAKLMNAMRTQQLRVAKMQAALTDLQLGQFYPLCSRICLSADWKQRREILLSIREDKLQTALEFVLSKTEFEDPNKTHFSEHKFETAGGDLCCIRYETVHFRGVESLQRVFDAVSFYASNMEIIVTERLGHLMLRDDYDTLDDTSFHTHFVATNESGVTVEGNVVTFQRLYDGDEDEGEEGPCGVFTVDFINEDKRRPYVPTQRVRKDTSGAIVLTTREEDGELVVTMRRAVFLKLHRPQFPISEPRLQDMLDSMTQWADVLNKTIRDMVYLD